MKIDNEIIGRNIEVSRRSCGYTIPALIKWLNIDLAEYSRIIHGKQEVPIYILEKLCDAFSCDEEYLLYNKGKRRHIHFCKC